MTRCSDSCLVDGGFQLARGDPSTWARVFFCSPDVLSCSAFLLCVLCAVPRLVVVLSVAFNLIPHNISNQASQDVLTRIDRTVSRHQSENYICHILLPLMII